MHDHFTGSKAGIIRLLMLILMRDQFTDSKSGINLSLDVTVKSRGELMLDRFTGLIRLPVNA